MNENNVARITEIRGAIAETQKSLGFLLACIFSHLLNYSNVRLSIKVTTTIIRIPGIIPIPVTNRMTIKELNSYQI